MIAQVALACIVLLYAVFCGFTVVWMVRSGEFAAVKTATWVAQVLYWHGAFIFGMLVLLGPLLILRGFGRYLMGGW